ncbi:MAG: hydantoinase/oxoprolinase N-terminal domain-containing protein, partial [Pseudomonadota bacterium]
MTAPGIIVGVDVGGTFTDVFVWDTSARSGADAGTGSGTGAVRIAKVPSTRPDQSQGFMDGIAAGIQNPGGQETQRTGGLVDISTIVHGTTVGTNALLERKGARTGLITTEGFRDVLEMRRRDRPRTWGLWGQFDPVIPRNMRLEVPERMLSDGTCERPVPIAAVEEAARALIGA